jgi:hypothetical protein
VKLIGSQLTKTLPAIYGTQRFIAAFKRARHLSVLPVCMNHLEVHSLNLPVLCIHSCRCISRQLASRKIVTETAAETSEEFYELYSNVCGEEVPHRAVHHRPNLPETINSET